MKVSLNWLRRYLPDLQASVEEISKALTSVGLEVEGIEDFGAAYQALIVAKVLECVRHPEADKLSVTKVFDGQNEIQVVCGAPNVAAGQTVVFAPLGSSLPLADGTELKLKKIKLRGVESSGMICAEDEIGLGDSHDGIMVLPDELVAGTPFVSLPDTYDVVYEINVTPNRPDALSHLGVARELARVFQIPLCMPALPTLESSTDAGAELKLEVEAKAGCSRYIARTIHEVQVGPSPLWLQRLLQSLGMRPISNVVDLTNFVLLEWGQPLHAFDLDKIKSKSLSVRPAREGEEIETLDEIKRTLKAGELLICDGNDAACVAGVMGGKSTEVDENTKNIVLETAYFHGSSVRRTARRLALHSDSSHRFERGIDPTQTAWVSEYAAKLIAEICGGKLSSTVREFIGEDHPIGRSEITLRLSRVAQILGYSPSATEVRDCLVGIGLKVVSEAENTLCLRTPGFRPDLEREIDLIEEVARLLGYDRVPTLFPALEMRPNALPKNEQISRKTRQFLAARGLHEGLSLRFESVKTLESLFAQDDARRNAVALQNPLSEEWAVLPPSFLGRMLKAASYNLRQQEKYVRLFEIAKTFAPAEVQDERKDNGVTECQVLAGVLAGDFELGLADKAKQVEFSDLRAILDGLFRDLRLNVEWKRPEQGQSFLHPLRQAELFLGNQSLGYAGEVHPKTAEAMDVDRVAYVFELNFDQMVKKALGNNVFKAFSRFGAMNRDLSLLVDERTDVAVVQAAVAKAKAKNLKSVELRSVYQGPGVDEGKKSLLFQFNYQAEDRTLTDDEVNQAHDKLRQNLAQNDQWTFR